MKGKWHKVLNPLMDALCIIVGIIIFWHLCVKGLSVDSSSIWVALTFIGIWLGYVIHSILHEIGHIVPLKKSQTKVLEFSVLHIALKSVGNKFKWSFNFKNDFSGYVTFVCKDYNRCKKYLKSSLVGAFVFSLSSFILLLVLAVILRNNFLWYAVFLGAAFGCLAPILLNFFCAMPTSDGYLLFGGDEPFNQALVEMEMQSRLYNGESLKEMPDELFSSDVNCKIGYYSYLRLMEKGDLENAEKMLERVAMNNEKYYDNQPIALDLEKFYVALIKNDTKTIDELKDGVLCFCDDNVTETTLRVAIKYRKYSGDDVWATTLLSTFEKQKEKALAGAYKTEKTIIDNFS